MAVGVPPWGVVLLDDDAERAALRRDAIGLWLFESSTALGLDTSSQSNHLTNNNSVAASTPGKPGAQAAAFVSASSQSLSRATTATLDMGDRDQAWAAWVFPTSSASAQAIIAKEGDTTLLDYMLSINLVSATCFTWTVFTGGVAKSLTAAGVTLNAWHLVLAWYAQATQTSFLQVDNGAISTLSIGGALDAATAAEFDLGRRARGGGSLYFDGSIGFVLGLQRLFTANERTYLWNGGAGRRLT